MLVSIAPRCCVAYAEASCCIRRYIIVSAIGTVARLGAAVAGIAR